MITLFLFRHSITKGNLEQKYIGITDEPLCEEGIVLAKKIRDSCTLPVSNYLYSSPLLRCIETAKLLYPEQYFTIIEDFKECNFGEFENRNYIQLERNYHYKEWIDSNGLLPFPNGESKEQFCNRCQQAFSFLVEQLIEKKVSEAVCIIHAGTIMAILEKYCRPYRPYYEWKISNLECISIKINEVEWRDKRIVILGK